MNPIFSITVKNIQNLSDEKSRELVARLCRAELRKKGLSEAFVTWGGDQRAKDGGVDVRVDIVPKVGISGYIKNDHSAFQVKAEKFSKGKISSEMAPKGCLRPAITELASCHGAYIIASTRDNLSDSSLANRISAMSECLSNYGLDGKILLDFYDCRKTTDWIEQHPEIAVWVRHELGESIEGWKPYCPWAYQEIDLEAEYLIDNRLKVFVPNADKGSDILTAINNIKKDLNNHVPVRIVGLSGVGKTRLVQALFDKRLNTERPALDEDKVIYSDLSDNPSPQPIAMVEALLSEDSDCIVVIDNCSREVHQRLTEIVNKSGSSLRIITVEYDIGDDIPEGTACYRLENSSIEVINELLKKRFRILSGPDRGRIAEFSDGNARVAFALASTTEATGELARLQDAQLFTRLFDQKKATNDELLRCAESASLLYSFDGKDINENSEMAVLASLAEVTVKTFLRNIVELQRRGLIQTRGKWRAVLPHAISNRLATQSIESIPKILLQKVLIENASDRVKRSFSRRLSFLHESKTVQEIVKEWLEPSGRYSDLTILNEIDFEIFSNIAPVNQEASVCVLEQAISSPGFSSTIKTKRDRLASVARSLAYEPDIFDRAVNILICLKLSELEDNYYNSSHEILKSLFYCHLSGTKAKSVQRSKIVSQLLKSEDEKRRHIGISLLKAALEASHFSSSFGFNFGARKRDYGWFPQSQNEVEEWYKPFIDIAVAFGKLNTELGREARLILGESIPGLWLSASMGDEISSAAKSLMAIDGWPEGWLGLKRALQSDCSKISRKSFQELLKLEKILYPTGLKRKIYAKVLSRGMFADEWYLPRDEGGSITERYRAARKEAEELGKAAAECDHLLFEILPDLLHKNFSDKVWNFGSGIGQASQDVPKLLIQVRRLLEITEPTTLSLIFIRGVISGWHKVRPEEVSDFFDESLSDKIWVKWFPELQTQVDLDNSGFKRLLISLEQDMTPLWQYKYLSTGRATDSLTVKQVSALVNKIASKMEDGLLIAVDLLGMVVYLAGEKDGHYNKDLASICILFLKNLNYTDLEKGFSEIEYDLTVVLEFALSAGKPQCEIAYSRASRPPIPFQAVHRFHFKSSTDSIRIRPVIPFDSVH